MTVHRRPLPAARRAGTAALLLLLAACGGTAVRAGGEASGFPDLPMGGRNMSDQYGTMDTGGTIRLYRDRPGR